MKKLIAILALVIGMVACQKEDIKTVTKTEEHIVTVHDTVPVILGNDIYFALRDSAYAALVHKSLKKNTTQYLLSGSMFDSSGYDGEFYIVGDDCWIMQSGKTWHVDSLSNNVVWCEQGWRID